MERLGLINEVKGLVDSWLAGNATRNITGLARESGVSESCVRRLYNNNSVPQNENLMKLLTVLSGQSSIENLRKYFTAKPSIVKFLLANYSFLETSPYLDSGRPLLGDETYIEDYHSFLVYAFASNRTPVKTDDVSKMFGMVGEMALEALVSSGLVSVGASGYLEAKISNVRPSKELIKKHLPEITRMFFKADSQFNCHILQSETVSKKGYGLAMDAFEKFLAEVGNVIQNHPGEVPLVIAGFLDTLTLKPYFKEETK